MIRLAELHGTTSSSKCKYLTVVIGEEALTANAPNFHL